VTSRFPSPSWHGTLKIQAALAQHRALNLALTHTLPGGDLSPVLANHISQEEPHEAGRRSSSLPACVFMTSSKHIPLARRLFPHDGLAPTHKVAIQHRRLTVPHHTELAKGTLRSIIRQAGLTVEEFSALL